MAGATASSGSVTRSSPADGFSAPEWWRPWSESKTLMSQTRDTVSDMRESTYMTWLDDRGREQVTLTFDSVWRTSGVIARRMNEEWNVELGDRVLLCYLPGTAFIVAYWACLRLRAVAVPAYPPDPSKLEIGLKKLALVAKSCDAKLCLTEKTLEQMRVALSLTHTWPVGLVWRRTDDVVLKKNIRDAGDDGIDAPEDPSAVAFLQYTSGSTGDPKGVMLTFDNMWHNINEMYLPGQLRHLRQRGVDTDNDRVVGVSWLPQFHDTGLVLCIVAPFVAGYHMINFSPLTFLRSPLLWMEALTKYGAHWSAAPDFSYELCVRRILDGGGDRKSAKSPKRIDLSTVRQLACGAGERCRPVQLARFLETFAEYGLRDDVYVPNYGLAEHVVGTCGCATGIKLSKSRPDLACCGEDFQCDLRIVDPVTHLEKKRGEAGEIWISSRSVAKGYWGKPELSRETFEARVAGDEKQHCFLRTGDEGYFEEDAVLGPQLYICGRIKDVIIVGGKNYFPEDIEVAAQEADRDHIRPGCVAAFAAQDGGTATGDETVTCVFELRKQAAAVFDNEQKLSKLSEDVRRAVGVASGLLPGRIVVIVERSIPKTTSGKVQRRQTRALLDSKGLKVLFDSAHLHPATHARSSSSFFWSQDSWLARSLDSACKLFVPGDDSGPQTSNQSRRESVTPPPPPAQPVVTASNSNNTNNNTVNGHDGGVVVDEEVTQTTRVVVAAIREVASGQCTASTPFHELGLSSRQTIELLRRVEKDVQVELPPALVFSCPTPAALAAEICKLRRGEEDDDMYYQADGSELSPRPPSVANVVLLSVAARLPGDCDDVARDLRSVIAGGVEAAGRVPFNRWDVDAVEMRAAYSAARARASYGAFCRGADAFDPAQFGMRLAEAGALDPQQRLFLERAYEALVCAGYRKDGDSSVSTSLFARSREADSLVVEATPLAGANVAVCLGMMNMDAAFSLAPEDVGPHDLTGNGYASAGSRLSFTFDMRGPCIVVDTACSASLVAGHAASNFVSSHEADAGLFAGTSLMLAPSFVHIGAAVAAMTSETGRCHTFDAAADGYCRGEGCAVVVIGRAREGVDREKNTTTRATTVSAAGFAVKHNGQSATFTALNASAQTRLMEATPGARSSTSVEAHGTGTKLGDPIEISGLSALKKIKGSERTLVSGIKANLGHTEPTAGVAGYLAAMLVAVSHEQQPNALLRTANPVAHFERIEGLRFATDSTPWLAGKSFGREETTFSCGVSSFGYSGIIAHAVISATARSIDNETISMPNEDSKVAERRVVLRRRNPREIDQARTLGKQLLVRKYSGPDPRHCWLRRQSSTAFDVEMAMSLAVGPSSSSRLIEVALAVAQATGATSVVDISLTPTKTVATVCVLDDTEIRLETKDGSVALSAQVGISLPKELKPLRHSVERKASSRPTHSVLLRGEVGAAWRIGSRNKEIKGLVAQLPHRMDSPTLRATAVEATRQLTSVMASREVEWTSVDEIVFLSNSYDDDSRRAWTHVVCSDKNEGETIVVDCDVTTPGPFISIRGASFRQCRVNPARVEGNNVYELGWHESTELNRTSPMTVVFERAPHTPGLQVHDNFAPEQVPLEGRMPVRDSKILLVATREQHVADIWPQQRANNMIVPRSLPQSLRTVASSHVDLVSSLTLGDGKLRKLKPRLSVANADAYETRQSDAAVYQPAMVVELGKNCLLPLVMRAFAGESYIVLLKDAFVSASVATELMAFSEPKPIVMVGHGSSVPARFLQLRNAEEIRVVVGQKNFSSVADGLDPSRIQTFVYSGTDAQHSWLAQRRRLAGCRSLAQVGHLSTTSTGDAKMLSACVRGATMISWATAILTPRAELRASLLPSRGLMAVAAEKPRRLSKERRIPKANIRSLVCEVVERVIGPEALTTSFADLGIDSLQGTEVAHDLSNRLGREVPPTLLLDANNVDEVVEILGSNVGEYEKEEVDESETALIPDGASAATTRLLPASVKCAESTPDQELLFWMSHEHKKFTWLPVTAIGDLVGDLDVEALERAIAAVVGRHEALRSRLVKVPLDDSSIRTLFAVDDDPCRRPRLIVRGACNAEEARRDVQAFHDEYENDPFSSDPPFRALLVRYPEALGRENESSKRSSVATNGVLYVSTSHAVSDGWSQQLLYNDLVDAYNNNGSFPANRVGPARRYCEFLVGHNEEVERRSREAAVETQRQHYAKAMKLPSRWPTVCSSDDIVDTLFESGSLLHSDLVSIVETSRLAAVEAKLQDSSSDLGRASLPSLVLAAYVAALGDSQLGSAVAVQYSHTGRIGHPELAETYGQLASDMNVVIQPSETSGATPQLGAFIANVHKAVVNSLSLASVPYALAYRATLGELGRAALPPIFNWYDRYSDVPQWRGLEAKEISVDQTKMRLRTFNVGAIYLMGLVQSDGSLCLKFFFNRNVYSQSTVQLAAERMQVFLNQFASHGPVSDEFSSLFSYIPQAAQFNLFEE